MAALEALEAARATLRRAELRTGVRSSAPSVPDIEEAPRPLGAILDGGCLPVGTASVIQGSTSLLLALIAQSQRASDWVAVVGAPSLGYLAAVQAGISLKRLSVIPHAGEDPAGIVAALLDGMRYVVVGPRHRAQRLRASAPARARSGARCRPGQHARVGAGRRAPGRRGPPVVGGRPRLGLPASL